MPTETGRTTGGGARGGLPGGCGHYLIVGSLTIASPVSVYLPRLPRKAASGGVPRPLEAGWYKRRLPILTPLPGSGGTQTQGIGGAPAAARVVGPGGVDRAAGMGRALVVLSRVPRQTATAINRLVIQPQVIRSDGRREGTVFRTPLIAAKINVAGGVLCPRVLRRDFERGALVFSERPFLKLPPPPVAGSVCNPLVIRFDCERSALVFVVRPLLAPPPLVLEGTTWISFYSEVRNLVWYNWDRLSVWEPGMATYLTKRSGETRQYTMDFSELPELASGYLAGVSSVVSNVLTIDASNLTLSSPAVGANGKMATVWISGGQPGASYQIAFTVTMAGGTVLEEFGYLLVEDE